MIDLLMRIKLVKDRIDYVESRRLPNAVMPGDSSVPGRRIRIQADKAKQSGGSLIDRFSDSSARMKILNIDPEVKYS